MKSKKGKKIKSIKPLKRRSRSLRNKPLKRRFRSLRNKPLKRRSRSLRNKPLKRRSRSLRKINIDGGKEEEELIKKINDKLTVFEERFEQKMRELEESVMTKFSTDSIVQLVSFSKETNPFFPHVDTPEVKSRGSGFIIDIENGYILTNSHVVENSIYLHAFTEKFRNREIVLRIISLCVEKDVALCQIIDIKDREDIQGDKKADDINMKFVDSFNIKHLDKVFVIGYPLGLENIKATGGTITGFYSNNEDDDDNIFMDAEDTSSYIETSAPVNPGNSGGPLIDINGKVIGIVSAGRSFAGFMRIAQNVNYVVGSRTILSIFDELVSNPTKLEKRVIVPARYSFRYNKTSKIQFRHLFDGNIEGIYVYKICKDSSFKDKLIEGDIICKITFNDVYNNPECLDIIKKCANEEKNIVEYEVKNDGFIVNTKYKYRKFILKELFDSIPIGTEITFSIIRDNKKETLVAPFENTNSRSSNRNKIVLPGFSPYKYIISYGLCIGELTLNHVFMDLKLNKFIEGDRRYENFLIVNWVFPQTSASNLNIKQGTVISKVNGKNTKTIEDIKEELGNSTGNDSLEIISFNGEKFVIEKNESQNNKIISQLSVNRPTIII
jgi:S1-C subfamily serine protease